MDKFQQFIQARRFFKNVTAKTAAWYDCSFTAFQKFHPEHEYTAQTLREFVIAFRNSGVSAISCNIYCRAINAYLRWLHEEGHTPELLRIPRLKTEQKLISTFNPTQVRTLVSWKPRTAGERRLHALVSTLLDTGIRIEEALSLKRECVDLENLLITVYGKGQKERVIPMSFELRKVLHRWLLSHNFPLAFPTRQGAHMTQRNVLRHFKTVATRLGISGVPVSFHTARHTFAVNYIRNGGDVFRLQRILGHSTLEMTRRYVNLQTEDLSAVHNRLSPLANMR